MKHWKVKDWNKELLSKEQKMKPPAASILAIRLSSFPKNQIQWRKRIMTHVYPRPECSGWVCMCGSGGGGWAEGSRCQTTKTAAESEEGRRLLPELPCLLTATLNFPPMEKPTSSQPHLGLGSENAIPSIQLTSTILHIYSSTSRVIIWVWAMRLVQWMGSCWTALWI